MINGLTLPTARQGVSIAPKVDDPHRVDPFDEDGRVDFKSLGTLANFYRHPGAQAIVVLSIMREAHALSGREREAVIKAIAARPDIPTVATISHAATAIAKDRAERARV